MVGQASLILPWSVAWRTSARLIGWLPFAGSAVTVALGLALAASTWHQEGFPSPAPRVVEVIVPLVFGIQAAFLLSPDSEPPLELLLTCPRPLAWALLERLAALIALLGCVALAGNLAALALPEAQNLPLAVIRWLAPCVGIGGAALFTTQMTRQGVFGALLATLLWGGMLFGFDSLLTRWPFLWPLHVYLQPETAGLIIYMLNRATLTFVGAGLTALAVYLLHDEERVLGMRGARA
jgi:hypothetical protein